jgi:two-component system sensor histidine kinase KdpD
MSDRLPTELRALVGLARSLATAPTDPDALIARACAEIRIALGFESVVRADRLRLDDRTRALVDRAERMAEAAADGDIAAVPLAIDGETFVTLVTLGESRIEPAELDLLTAFGMLAGLLVDKARRDAELTRLLGDLRRANELKTDFISVASHELRAPAAVVHGIAATLVQRGAELAEEQRAQLRGALYEQSARLRDLIDQLLDLSRIEAGRVRVQPCRFRPREWIDALLGRLALNRRSEIDVEIDPELEVETDPHAVERVVGNLVTNALKYGRPPVRIAAQGGATFCLVVEDRGKGVPPEFVPDLFGRFTRSEPARRSGRSGAGLGLSIARSYAEAVGGTLHYEHADPHGARFVLELPEALVLGERQLDEERRAAPPV